MAEHHWPVTDATIAAAIDQVEWRPDGVMSHVIPEIAFVAHTGTGAALFWCACTVCPAVDLVYAPRLGHTCVWCNNGNIGQPPPGRMVMIKDQAAATSAFQLGGLAAVRAVVT